MAATTTIELEHPTACRAPRRAIASIAPAAGDLGAVALRVVATVPLAAARPRRRGAVPPPSPEKRAAGKRRIMALAARRRAARLAGRPAAA